jgi:molecular chaperone DnaK (HSP70)
VGKKNKVITIDKGRLSEGEIERIVKDEEYVRAEHEKEKRSISAQNGLQSYCLNMKSAVEDGKLKDKSLIKIPS